MDTAHSHTNRRQIKQHQPTHKPRRHVVIAGPAFATKQVLQPLVRYLEERGCTVHLVQYRDHPDIGQAHTTGHGHPIGGTGSNTANGLENTDTRKLPDHSMETYFADTQKTIEEVGCMVWSETGGSSNYYESIHLVGISMGAPLVHRYAQEYPHRFSGVTLYGSPQMGGLPVWKTLFKILSRTRYCGPIISRSGKVFLRQRDIEDLLFGGYSHEFILGISRTPEAGNVLWELLTGKIAPNKHESLTYTVIGAEGELFHRNTAKKQWAKRSKHAKYREVSGSHFGALLHYELQECIAVSIHDSFNAIDRLYHERRIDSVKPTTLLPLHPDPHRTSTFGLEF